MELRGISGIQGGENPAEAMKVVKKDTEYELPQKQETNNKTSRFSKEIRKWCMFYYHDIVWVNAAGTFPRPGRYKRCPGGWYNKVSSINI